MTTNLVEFQSVSHDYALPNGRRIRALRNVEFAMRPGEFVALIGANGSGKSTMARLINALLLPSGGKVMVKGLDTSRKENLLRIRQTAAMVFQSPRDQIVGSTVEEDVAFGPENLGVPRAEIAHRVEHALRKVEMWHLRERPPFQLSAGQAQRVAVAGAIAMLPELLILDEATTMLDPAGRRAVLEIAAELHAQGMAILLITHFPEEAVSADRVVVLKDGEIVEEGAPRSVFSDRDRLMKWGLDVPPVTKIAHSLHEIVPTVRADALTAEEVVVPLKNALTGKQGSATHRSRKHFHQRAGTFLEAEDLWHVYMVGTPLETVALKGVDFSVPRGGSAGLMGSTGSGKSTLMQHLNGLLFPQRGRVLVDGVDVAALRGHLMQLRRSVSMVFQQPEDQIFERFVGDDVAYGLRKLGLSRDDLRQRVREAMEAVGLDFERYKDRLTYTLSGGERRKVALAGALALNPDALLLDEPTAGLDPASRGDILARLKLWKRERGLTMVYSSHSADELAEMAERITVMDDGKVVMAGTPSEVFGRREELLSLGLEVPIAARIASVLEAAGIPLGEGVLSAEDLVHAVKQMMEA